MATITDISIDQGADFQQTFQINNSSGLPWDFTAYTGKAQVRRFPTSQDLLGTFAVQASSGGQVTISMPASGTVKLPEVPNGQVAYLAYDVLMTSSGGAVSRVVQGKVTVNPGVTI